MLRHISFPPWWQHLFEEIEGFLRSSFSRAIFSHTLVERHISQVSNVPEKQVLHDRSYTSNTQLHILHVLQIQRTWDLPGMSQTWRWPCRSRRSRNTCILFQELESSLVSSRWFQAIGGSIDFYKFQISMEATSLEACSNVGSWHRLPAYLHQGLDTSPREPPGNWKIVKPPWNR